MPYDQWIILVQMGEIVTSADFRTAVLSKDQFSSALRAVCVDEAHCISLWGGSFRPDYAGLGVLRGRFPKNVPFVVASATLPHHVLNDVRHKLQLGSDTKMVQLTNARPNVALSVQKMKHSEETKGDIRFLSHQASSAVRRRPSEKTRKISSVRG
ncbi:uncharacterized protein LACBIDRAFT_304222 [Laccaria bicolor S238N-H82]|uniref:DNA 3'-5' helicase n=1 Tax=Laccaria bicolor (strain S238N-H82 / ATCC MYA-4686) TaxID=486041 RepID=B0DL62_LACBS|nr:uncharacterized protein LACBIDRAFT_304222 [Laccaria bicolor S238N-H82]EDR04596.1 predicted protein [Laccaria bicolor S238N-H82]|eukprot:XP_001884768.1 predicted protein [Laccaria bicolor S238N-H82]